MKIVLHILPVKMNLSLHDSLTDTHAHLDYQDYDADRSEVVARARSLGVEKIISIGIGRDSITRTLRLTETYDGIFAAVGVHPTHLSALPLADWSFLEQSAQHPKVIAIGETGLDYHHPPECGNLEKNREQQHLYFHRQLELAKTIDKPVIIHSRNAFDDTLKVLKAFGRFRKEPGVLHCFGADLPAAHQVFELGYVISTGGILTFKNSKILQEVVCGIPHDKLLLETDCPYLAPTPHRGKRNEPGYTRLVAERLAELWNEPLEKVLTQVAQNVQRVFGI